jgi:hypothetical protein
MKTLLFLLMSLLVAPSFTEPVTSVELTLQTRGTRKSLTVSARQTEVVINDERQSAPTTPRQWVNLEKAAQALIPNRLAMLKAPSTRSYTDAAFAAQVRITAGSRTYESTTFDQSNPPRELAPLLKALLAAAPKAVRGEFE